MMTRQKADVLIKCLMDVIREDFVRDHNLHNFDVANLGGKFGFNSFSVTIQFTDKTAVPLRQISLDELHIGMAPPGTKIIYGYDNKPGTIIKARTKKYLFSDDQTGRQLVIDFRGVRFPEKTGTPTIINGKIISATE